MCLWCAYVCYLCMCGMVCVMPVCVVCYAGVCVVCKWCVSVMCVCTCM